MDAFDINPAIAGAVKQTSVAPSSSVLGSVVPYGVLSRSAGGGEKAFFDGTKHIVRNNLKSHGKLLEILRWYGQAADLLGYVSYATATYRNVSLSNGGGTINGITFTAGINAASKAILFAPGSFCAAHWVGNEGVVINQVDATNAIVATGKLVGVQAEYGYITVDFTPIAASSTTSHRLCFQGMEAAKDMVGIKKIITTTSGNLFGIPVTSYSLWKGIAYSAAATKFTFDMMSTVISLAVNRGGLDGDIDVHVNPRTWSRLLQTEAGRRFYDKSYNAGEAENGADGAENKGIEPCHEGIARAGERGEKDLRIHEAFPHGLDQ